MGGWRIGEEERVGAVAMEYVVYCDESRHSAKPGNTHLAIGGLWVPLVERDRISREVRSIARENGLGSELKWSKVSGKYAVAYERIVEYFLTQPSLNFRAIVVEHAKFDPELHGGDRELGFYKFYFRMLEKWLFADQSYTVLLDFQKNKGADRFGDLRRVLVNAVPKATIHELTVIESSDTPLAQLCDILTGAVSAGWCEAHLANPSSAKSRIGAFLARGLGWPSLRVSSVSPAWSKFNVFSIDLTDREGEPSHG